MSYLFIAMLIAVYFIFDTSLGYSLTSPIYTHFTYVFQHAGLLHLVANSISFLSFYNLLHRVCNAFYYPYLIAVLASFFSEYDKVTIGASGMIYAMIGMTIGYAFKGEKLKITSKKKFALMILLILVSLLMGFFNGSNNVVHIISLILGIIVVL